MAPEHHRRRPSPSPPSSIDFLLLRVVRGGPPQEEAPGKRGHVPDKTDASKGETGDVAEHKRRAPASAQGATGPVRRDAAQRAAAVA